MSENVYSKLLLSKGNGYPLFIPEPDENLPSEYRERGVSIGDVGIITPEGGFDVLFNACQPATHPINDDSVPEDFVPFLLGNGDVAKEPSRYSPGTVITSTDEMDWTWGSETEESSVPSFGDYEGSHNDVSKCVTQIAFKRLRFFPKPDVLNFSFKNNKDAFLILPDGGSREDLVNVDSLRAYAHRHAVMWSEFANGRRSQMADNSSLQLVTGCDKAKSWALGLFSGPAMTTVAGKTAHISYALHSKYSVSPQIRFSPVSSSDTENQCVFLRGLSISFQTNDRQSSSLLDSFPGQHLFDATSKYISGNYSYLAPQDPFISRNVPHDQDIADPPHSPHYLCPHNQSPASAISFNPDASYTMPNDNAGIADPFSPCGVSDASTNNNLSCLFCSLDSTRRNSTTSVNLPP